MRTGSVLFLLGVLLLCRLESLPPPALGLAFFPVLFLFAVPRWRWLVWLAGGFLWAQFRAGLVLDTRLDPELEGRTLIAAGAVSSLPAAGRGKTRFEFDIRTLEDAGGRQWPSPGRVRLSWYRDAPRVEPGDAWRLTVRLRRPLGFSNPGGFDYEGWLFQNGIRATGYVLRGVRVAEPAWPTDSGRVRLWLREQILERFPGRSRAALLAALAMGDTSSISAADWQILTRTGTSHLLAISGLHIALVAGIGFGMARKLWPLLGRAPLWLPAPHAGAAAAVFGATVYAVLAGFGIPTQRALIMVLVWTLALSLCRNAAFSQVLAASLCAVLLFDPLAVLAPGFWLSFVAVAVIGLGMRGRSTTGGWWRRWGRVHVVIATGLLPFLVHWFHEFPVLTVPANLVAVPWISLLTVPLVLLGCALLPVHVPAAHAMLDLALRSVEMLWPLLRMFSDPGFSTVALPDPGMAALGMALVGAAILILPCGIPARWIGALWMLPLLIPAQTPLRHGEVQLAVLDVGQGLAAVVRTRRHVLLYDTGPRYGPEFSAGSAAVLPYLGQAGIGRVDMLVLSHGDSDHAGGLQDVLRGTEVVRILAGHTNSVPHPAVAPCAAGQRWFWDGVEFAMLHPPPGSTGRDNNQSCVLRLRVGSRAVLFTGDIESAAEATLLSAARDELPAQLLIAPHHGSRTSSSLPFVKAVRPDIVIFAAGYRNRFGFPKQDIIERYQQHGARILDTARSGAIDVRLQEAGISILTHRQSHRRFWHSRI